MDDEDFGLAKSFSTAPLCMLAPGTNIASKSDVKEVNVVQDQMDNEIRSDGFCFKLHPSENQVQFQKDLKLMAPKMMDVKKGTTTLAFEF